MVWPGLMLQRKNADELMDLPSTSREDFEEALKDIRWVNQNLGGAQTLVNTIQELARRHPQASYKILDLGTGSADIPIALAHWGRSRKLFLEMTAVDLHPVAVEAGNQLTAGYPEIVVLQGDALNLQYPDQSFDMVVSSMFMHHLTTPEATRLLQEMARLSKIGFVVNDLERHPLAWAGISLVGRIFGMGRVFRHDAPLSVLRGFTLKELQELRQLAGLPDLEIRRQRPYRVVLSWERHHAPKPSV